MTATKTNDELVDEINAKFTLTVLPVTTFLGIEVLIGFFGNVLVLIIVNSYFKVSNLKYFVVCLGVIDIVSCCFTMPSEMYSQTNFYRYTSSAMCKIKSFLNMFTVVAETLCLLTIALDRYRKVCRPLGWQIQSQMAKRICYVCFVMALLVSLPIFPLWGIREDYIEYRDKNVTYNVSCHFCEKDGKFSNEDYTLIHLLSVYSVLALLLLTMLICYIIVAKTLLGRQREQLHISPQVQSFGVPALTRNTLHEIGAETTLDITTEIDTDISTNNELSSARYHNTECEKAKKTELSNKDIPSLQSKEHHHDSPAEGDKKATHHKTEERRRNVTARVRRKTLIMFILTFSFITTMVLYFISISLIARSGSFVENLSDRGKAVMYFFCRLYFINHVINPFVYGFLDPKFKTGLKRFKTNFKVRLSGK